MNRRSDAIAPFQMTTPSRRNRTFEPRVIDAVEHVATGDLADAAAREKTSRTSASPVTTSSNSGLSMPTSALLHVFEHLVDDLVEAHLHALVLGELARLAVGTHVEADDGRVRHRREVDVGLGDPADAAVHERQPHLVVLLVELAQRVGERFERTLHVGLQHEVERGDLAPLHHREDVLEAGAAGEASSGASGSAARRR